MTFLHFYLLGGLALVGVPILVHLVTREKPRHVRFPAFRFLIQKYHSNRRKLRLHHILLLLLRMALILLLCLALARPQLYSERLGRLLSTTQPVAAVLIFDTSPSMEFERGGISRLDDARRRALELLAELPENSKVAILDSSERGGEFLDRKVLIRDRVQGLKISPANGPVTRLFDRAYTMLTELAHEYDGVGEPPPRYLYVFSDRARASWDTGDLRKLKPPDGVSCVYVNVGVQEPEDVAVERIEVEPPAVTPGRDVTVTAFIRATGRKADRKVLCQIDGLQRVQEQVVQVEANMVRPVTFKYRAAPADPNRRGAEDLSPGAYQAVVRLEGNDRLPFNNHRFATFVVRPGRRILTLMDDPETTFALKHWQVLLEILGFSSEIRSVEEAGKLDIEPARGPDRVDRKGYDLVWLFQARKTTDVVWAKLNDYVQKGGKLAIVPGGTDRGYNSAAARELLPATLTRLERSPSDSGVPWSFDLNNKAPMMAPFLRWKRERDNVDFLLQNRLPVARRFWAVRPASDARRVAWFTDPGSSPALLERDVGQGRVVLFTTRLDTEAEKIFPNHGPLQWTNFWESSFGMTLVDKACRYLAGDSVAPSWNYICGETVTLSVLDRPAGASFTLTGPGLPPQGIALTIPPTKPEGDPAAGRLLPISRAVLPGNYSVTELNNVVRAPFERFSLNVRPEESVLSPPVEKEIIEGQLGKDSLLTVEHGLSLRDAIARKPQPLDLLPWLMLALLLFLGLENLVANRRRDVPPEQPPSGGFPVRKALGQLFLWTGAGALAGSALGTLRGGGYAGVAAGVLVTALLGAAHAVVMMIRFGARDGAILGGLLGSMVGVLYGWLIVAPMGWFWGDGPTAVLFGMILGGAVMGLDGWFLGARMEGERREEGGEW
jgi:Aerotolerance regulator N-terminal